MTNIAKVSLWGRVIGAVHFNPTDGYSTFQYDPEFARSGIQLSPMMMPLSESEYIFRNLPKETFHGLPGMLADSLPDRFGNAMINVWLAQQGRMPDSFNPVERLCYIGSRGMGALEFSPTSGPRNINAQKIEVSRLVELASQMLTNRTKLQTSFAKLKQTNALKQILQISTSPGGARAKALIAWNRGTNEVRSGQVNAGPGFESWLLKFDGVSGNKDKELEDPKGYGAIEFAYYLMVKDAGITISESRLLEENGHRHFMTKRFDRQLDNKKIHMQSLAALGHYDFNATEAYSYEQAIIMIRLLNLPMATIEEQVRRMIFNIVARNQDDHVKNIGFLMDAGGNWSLSPAFDVTYSYNPLGDWTSRHQMSMNGKVDNFTHQDFKSFAKMAGMKRGRIEQIINDVQSVVKNWPVYAQKAGVAESWIKDIQGNLRLEFPQK